MDIASALKTCLVQQTGSGSRRTSGGPELFEACFLLDRHLGGSLDHPCSIMVPDAYFGSGPGLFLAL